MIGSRARQAEGTTPFDVARDDETMREVAHKIITKIR
jgi:hypothetical protein